MTIQGATDYADARQRRRVLVGPGAPRWSARCLLDHRMPAGPQRRRGTYQPHQPLVIMLASLGHSSPFTFHLSLFTRPVCRRSAATPQRSVRSHVDCADATRRLDMREPGSGLHGVWSSDGVVMERVSTSALFLQLLEPVEHHPSHFTSRFPLALPPYRPVPPSNANTSLTCS